MHPNLRDLGLEDRNNDGIIDYVGARIYVADDASPEEIAAAANIAARLAFETTSMDLPVGFRASDYESGRGTAILVGRAAIQIQEAGAVRFENIEDAERFARTGGAEHFTPVEHASQEAAEKVVRLSNLHLSARHIFIGPDSCSVAVIDLASRIALESVELRLPLVTVARSAQGPLPANTIAVGLTNPYIQNLIRTAEVSAPAQGTGIISMIEGFTVIAGGDPDGESEALRYAALRMPYVSDYGKGRRSLASIEDEVRRYCPAENPAPELIFEENYDLPWEVDEARRRIRESLIPFVRPGHTVDVDLRLSEPQKIRQALATEIRSILPAASIRILSAHKQGFCWIDEELKPLLKTASSIRIRFRDLESPENSLDSADRWLHELYPIDEILARDLGLPVGSIAFERVPSDAPHIYEVTAEDDKGERFLHATFDPCSVVRSLFDIFPEYATARVATGWLRASVNGVTVVDERIKTDYECFWDEYQARTLPQVRDYILRLHDGRPRAECAPHFEELTVELQLSEPDFRIGIDEERISTLEALHEDIYFETLLFFDILGNATCGKPLKYPGRIIPRIRPSREGAGKARVRLTGYLEPFPHDRPFAKKNPAVTAVIVRSGGGPPAIEILAGVRFSWLLSEPAEFETMKPRSLTNPVVQWNEPIGPEECEQTIGRLANFPEVRPFLAGRSWLGRPIWAMDVVAPTEGKYFSEAKAATTKPCLFITGRQHANEVSSTSHILRLVELLATDAEHRKLLDRVNFIIQPMTNPDGAALVDELHKLTPDFMLHAGYLGALGADVTDEQWSEVPRYPEARIRADLWRMWQPDVVLNPHGYPSHEWVQLFSGYTAWVRSRRVRARDWWIPRGWFMPRFDFIDDEGFPHHRTAALQLRDRISEAIERSLGSINQRMYRRYAKYTGCDLDLHRGVLIHSSSHGLKPKPDSFGFMTRHPEVTFFEGLSEAPDEVASGEWLRTLATAGLEFSLVHARFLAAFPDGTIRTRWKADGADVFRISRTRLPGREP